MIAAAISARLAAHGFHRASRYWVRTRGTAEVTIWPTTPGARTEDLTETSPVRLRGVGYGPAKVELLTLGELVDDLDAGGTRTTYPTGEPKA